jgi:L-ascorbate metabolism protein UlaG (beta-lactamase superfamily)
MHIKWLGHSSFLITSQDQTRVITDPYTTGDGIKYNPINESAHIVTRSHNHGDHNNTQAVKGNPVILTEPGTYNAKGINFKAIPVYHDAVQGNKRGNDLIFCFKIDNLNLCHLGDLGHHLTPSQLVEIGPVDVLFIPVGGYYTIDSKEATTVGQSIQPRLIFPMHYKTAKTDFPLSVIEEFLKGKKNIRRINSSEIEIQKENLPSITEIIVLQSAN